MKHTSLLLKAKLFLLSGKEEDDFSNIVVQMVDLGESGGLEALVLYGVDSETAQGYKLATQCLEALKSLQLSKIELPREFKGRQNTKDEMLMYVRGRESIKKEILKFVAYCRATNEIRTSD